MTDTTRDIRIVFMGTPDFAVGVLKQLLEAKRNVVAVITAPDKPAGRGRKLRPSAVKEFAVANAIDVLQPTNLKNEDFIAQLKSYNPTLQIVVAFRMLPKVVWQLPAYGTFNLHASLLPQYRGAAPINWAIINGEKTTGVTTFFIDEKIDTGAIIAKEEVTIEEKETAGSLHDTLMEVGAQLVVKTVDLIENNKATPVAQAPQNTLKEAPKLHTDNTEIDWNASGKSIEYFVRGLSPFPVAWTTLYNKDEKLKVKIYDAIFEKEETIQENGIIKASKKQLKVAVKDGWLYIKEIQLPGKRKMEVTSLLNGYTFEENAKMA